MKGESTMKYMICYNLRNPNRKYKKLHRMLRQLRATHVFDSLCVFEYPGVDTDRSNIVFNVLSKSLEPNDGLLVVALNRDARIKVSKPIKHTSSV